MQCSQLALYNRRIILIQPPVLDEEGETEFSYNYFEDDVWEIIIFGLTKLVVASLIAV